MSTVPHTYYIYLLRCTLPQTIKHHIQVSLKVLILHIVLMSAVLQVFLKRPLCLFQRDEVCVPEVGSALGMLVQGLKLGTLCAEQDIEGTLH